MRIFPMEKTQNIKNIMAPTSNWNNYYFNYADYFRNDFKMKAQSDDASNIKKVQWQTLVNIDISSLP